MLVGPRFFEALMHRASFDRNPSVRIANATGNRCRTSHFRLRPVGGLTGLILCDVRTRRKKRRPVRAARGMTGDMTASSMRPDRPNSKDLSYPFCCVPFPELSWREFARGRNMFSRECCEHFPVNPDSWFDAACFARGQNALPRSHCEHFPVNPDS